MRFRKFLLKVLRLLKEIAVADLVIALIVGLSFLFTRHFTFLAYSERLFYAGVIAFLIGGMVGLASMFAGRSFGIPLLIRRPEEAKNLLDHFPEYREEVEKRYDASIQIWLTGFGCLVISALVQVFLT